MFDVEQSESAALRCESSAKTVVGENKYVAFAAYDLDHVAPLAKKWKAQAHDFSIHYVKSLRYVHGAAQ